MENSELQEVISIPSINEGGIISVGPEQYKQLEEVIAKENGLTPIEEEAIDKATMADLFEQVLKGKRPKDMPYEMYKQIQKLQTKKLNERKQGKVIWPAQYKVDAKVNDDGSKTEERWYKNRTPFVKAQYEAFVKQEQQKEIERINEKNKLMNNVEDKPQSEVK